MGKIRTHICKELSGGLKQIHVVTNNRSSNMAETEIYADNKNKKIRAQITEPT